MENSASGDASRQVRVLICEDEGLTALYLRRVLQAFGYHVVGMARDGEDAARLAEQLAPDVVLMDVQMPRLDGIAAAARIMRDCPAAIVMLTAFNEREVVEQALAAGASGYLVKPVRDEQLEPAISLALARFRQLRSLELAASRKTVSPGAGVPERELIEEAERRAGEAEQLARDLGQRLREEKQTARLLAETFLCPTPTLRGVQVATHYEPAMEAELVGGDYFDFIDLGEERIGIVLGDACGKGAVAAAFTARARYMLRAYAVEDPAPAVVLSRLNRALCSHMSAECPFLTLVYGVLDLGSRSLTYSNAGHPPPLLLDAGAGGRELGATGGLVGGLPEMEYRQETVVLRRDSLLALFTDGVTEARGPEVMLGAQGVRAVVEARGEQDAASVARAILARAREASGGQLRDDVAIIVLRGE